MLGLGVTPYEVLLQAVGSADDPSSGGRQMPSHWGHAERHIVTQSSPTGSQCIPAVGCAEAARYLVPPPAPARARRAAATSSPTSPSARAPAREGEFWESLNTACTLHLPVLYVVADNGYAISVPAADQAPGAGVRAGAGLPGPGGPPPRRHRLLRGARAGGQGHRPRPGRRRARRSSTSTSPGRTPTRRPTPRRKYRSEEELTLEAAADPLKRMADTLVAAGVLTADEVDGIARGGPPRWWPRPPRRALAADRPDPDEVAGPRPGPRPPEPVDDPGDGDPVAFGEAINRTLHEVMAADERIRVFGEDVADAREAVLADVEGKGGVFGTTHGLQRDVRPGPLLQHAAGRGQHHRPGRRPGRPGPAPASRRSSSSTTSGRPPSSSRARRPPSAGARTARSPARWSCGCRSAATSPAASIWHSQCGESIFAHVPGLAVAFPSRAADAVGLLRAALPGRGPRALPRAQAPAAPALRQGPVPGPDHLVPFGRGVVRRPGTT